MVDARGDAVDALGGSLDLAHRLGSGPGNGQFSDRWLPGAPLARRPTERERHVAIREQPHEKFDGSVPSSPPGSPGSGNDSSAAASSAPTAWRPTGAGTSIAADTGTTADPEVRRERHLLTTWGAISSARDRRSGNVYVADGEIASSRSSMNGPSSGRTSASLRALFQRRRHFPVGLRPTGGTSTSRSGEQPHPEIRRERHLPTAWGSPRDQRAPGTGWGVAGSTERELRNGGGCIREIDANGTFLPPGRPACPLAGPIRSDTSSSRSPGFVPARGQ